MDKERYQRLQAIFNKAVELDSDARRAYLDETCADDADLRREVELLLDHDREASHQNHFDKAQALVASAMGIEAEPVPDTIGHYRIIEKIGEGGMGRVFLAEQEDPRRRVALKVIRPELLSPSLYRRFQREVEVLGKLQHPGIAQIHEAGKIDTRAGPLPYFAMEYVQGEELRNYVKGRNLNVRSKLLLMAGICDAAHHAHLNGIVHRDLKPDNVLVMTDTGNADDPSTGGTVHDGSGDLGQPKILDFGVARATDSDIQLTTLQTEAGKLVGTVTYMSPEQVAGDTDAIDMRSDIYSLGSILYELLAGHPPFKLAKKPIPEAARIIREVEPTRLGSIHTDFRGDIDTIVTKALEKDRDRRYASAAEMAADIRRYLANEPIIAHPPSAIYELKKFGRRHRGLVAGLALSFLILTLGIVVSTLLTIRARQNEAVANRNAYRLNITTAQALANTKPLHAQEYLDAVPDEFRQWEWHHQQSRLDAHIIEHSGDHFSSGSPSLARRVDGTIVAALNRDNGIEVIDVATGEILTCIKGPNLLETRAFSPDGSLLATWCKTEERFSLWDVDRGVRIQEVQVRGDYPTCSISSDNSRIAFRGSQKELLYMTDIDAGNIGSKTQQPLLPSSGGFLFDPIQNRIAFSHYYDFHLFSKDGTKLASAKFSEPGSSIAFSPDGTRIAIGDIEQWVTLYDTATLQVEKVLSGHSGLITAVVFSHDGKWMASTAKDRTIRIWDLRTGQTIRTLPALRRNSAYTLLFSQDGTTLIAANASEVRLWKWQEDGCRTLRNHGTYVYQVAFHPKRSIVASSEFHGDIRLWDSLTGELLDTISTKKPHKGMGFNSDGSRLLFFDVAASHLSSKNEFALYAYDSGAGVRLTAPRQAGDEWIFNTYGLDPGILMQAPEMKLISVAGESTVLHPDGSSYAKVYNKNTIQLFEQSTKTLIKNIGSFDAPLYSVAFSPDASMIAGGDADGLIKVYDLETGIELAVLQGHIGKVYSLDFSPDNSRLVSSGNDKNIFLWDVGTFERVAMLSGHESYVHSVRFSPDGTQIASGSGDGTVRIWDSISPSERMRQYRSEQPVRIKAMQLVSQLLHELGDPLDVADHLRNDPSLDAKLRNAALRALFK